MSDLLKFVGEQLRMIRLAKGLSQEQVAERTGKEGMSKSRISDIESGKVNVTLKTLESLMHALDIMPSELFDFQKLGIEDGIEDKQMLLDLHRITLMERSIDEVKYVVRTTKDFLNTMDAKSSKGNKRS
ncbi:MerR family transcriptional regulator [Paenibacillus alvei TS-15]|jgi:transcriptional regulator with XRE-family HTH domain|uniref:Helix-turn-helix domain-containing protein n=3 Tax=Paenibacillus TaxID=44249 RepID=A0A383R4H8_PAEAL|nr:MULTISPECIES: helix-turn-helix transcriptional regulator [Paenibacillus]EPY05595.1 MerR family transcriptional regulator [Paenibacillus alvei TS-15]MCM3292130.1 helix-turn-helix domain-containing protein [Paenibacillus sp. MER 180]MCY9529506.1 helix-turn-helix domain-containing protein [Paenibacillus alvei]MDT8979366.1 helix-turn-helix transcriptional regulator [Paenibacillus sp. chi10]OBY80091.1 transcriptional regulator [Paenibacillus sp. KS1]